MATISNISSKYQEIISKSTQISRGIPAIYQLKPNKKEMGPLTMLTVGERHDNQSNKTILLVGETGTGKSSLINALFNHMIGVTWDDQVWFEIAIEEKRSQSESQTSDVIVYQIFGFEGIDLPFSLSIIDTPGYGDTRDIERDVIIIERLLDLFWMRDGIREVNAVGLVLKASECRLKEDLQYAFNSVMSLFGKDLEKNIVALLTYSDGKTPKNALQALENAKIKCARNEKNQPHHFLFNNQQNEERTEEDELPLDFAWKITERGMKQLMTFMKDTSPQKLYKTVNVLNERIRLTACIQNLQDRIEYIELKQKEIQQIKKAVKQQEGGMEQNQNFEVEVDEPYKEKEDVSGGMFFFMYSGATCCLRCEETCHYPGCTVTWYPSWCEVMKNNQCTVCRGKCPVDCHVKEEWRYVTKTRKVKKTNAIMKEMYEKFNSEKDKYSNLLEFLMGEDRQMMEEKKRLLDEAYKHLMSLKQLALSIDAVSTFIDYDFLIEKMRERGDEAKELEEMKSQAEQENKSQFPVALTLQTSVKAVTMATMSNISSKYQEIISKSTQISRGIPAIYQLKPNKKEMGTLTMLTVGERHHNQSNKTILLVGETGTGKSTLINALFNHMIGVTWDDQVWFEIAIEEQKSQSESQTSDVIVYQIFGFEGIDLPFSLSIIDTPGYGDTRGIERDVMISERLLDLFRMRDGIREVNAVGLVLKATECRLSDRLQYAFNSVMSLFGKDLEKNIVALLTYSDGKTPKNALQALENAKIKCARNEKNQPHHFLFNNQQNEERTEEDELPLENAWKVTERGMKQLMTFMKKTPPQKLDETVNVLNERVCLTACIQNLQDRIEYIELKQKEIQQIKGAVNEEEVVVDEPYKVKEDVSGGRSYLLGYSGATCCLDCEETCHYPCTVARYPSGCEVMKNKSCTVCSGKCSVDRHVKKEWRYVTKTRKVKKTIPDLKKMYENSNLLEGLEADERKKMEEKKRLLDEAYKHMMSLKQFALSINAMSTFIPYDFLIENMRERGDEAKAKELEKMKSQAEQEKKSATGNFGAKLMGMFKLRSK